MKCPDCGLENPPGVAFCDCGYCFASTMFKQYNRIKRPIGSRILSPGAVFGIITGIILPIALHVISKVQEKNPPVVRPFTAMHPLDQMTSTFAGNHTRTSVKSRVEKAMFVYGLEFAEENYKEVEGALTTLRIVFEASEMEILSYMIQAFDAGEYYNFKEMAVLSAKTLAKDERVLPRSFIQMINTSPSYMSAWNLENQV